MSTLTEWTDTLKAQLESFEMLSKSEIARVRNGKSDVKGYFRNNLFEPWKGPMLLTHIDYETVRPFSGDYNSYRLFTKTLPIEPQTVTLIPWSGGKCPVNVNTTVLIRRKNGWEQIDKAGNYNPKNWKHMASVSEDYHIIAYRPITIDIEEG